MKNHVPRYFLISVSRNSAFRSGFLSILMLSLGLSCKTGGGDPSPDRVEALCRLASEKLVSVSSSPSVRGGGFEATFQVDEQSRLVLETVKGNDPDGKLSSTKTKQYTYDADGFLTSIVDTYTYESNSQHNRKVTHTFEYADGRLVKEVESGPSEAVSIPFEAVREYTYDAKGALSKKTVKFPKNAGSSEQITTYADGKVASINQSGSTYDLNAQGLLINQKNSSGTFGHEYNANGQLIKSEYLKPDGSKVFANTYEYADIKFKQIKNPVPFKGFPVEPSERGTYEPIAKQENFSANASGTYDKDDSIVNVYKLDGQGNLVTRTETHTMPSQTMTYTRTYGYADCK